MYGLTPNGKVRLPASAAALAIPITINAIVATRQKLSFRRMRRRSTMRSASSDMAAIPYFAVPAEHVVLQAREKSPRHPR